MLSRIHTKTVRRKTVVITVVFVAAVFVFSAFFYVPTHAQAPDDTFGVQPIEQNIALAGTDIRVIIGKIIRAALGLLGIIALALIVYAGFIIMTSGGDEQKITEGKKILINATIGLVIILSALAIVQFVLNALDKAIRGGEELAGGGPQVRIDTFEGSGGLGRIIKDHYPFRGETNVARNTRLAITFAEPVDPATIIEDSNNNRIFGDCRKDDVFDWAEDCDHLKSNALKIYVSTTTSLDALLDADFVAAAALTTYDKDGKATTFTFRPFADLGNAEAPVWYTVHVSNNVTFVSTGRGIFENIRTPFYEWEFQTGIMLDRDPPHVESVIPRRAGETARNTIIQVNFDEAIDPTSAQGLIGPDSSFINLIFHNAGVTGAWEISNGYRTVEFLSDQPCGVNSCGQTMYCLPVACADPNDTSCKEDYTTLVRTAELLAPDSWEAVPFSGVVDMTGNALDGNKDNRRDGKPRMGWDFKTVRAEEKAADNFWWDFVVKNHIDRTAPTVMHMEPSVDKENVREDAPLTLDFSKPLWSVTTRNIGLEEYPSPPDIDPLWYAARTTVEHDDLGHDYTKVTIEHRFFGPDHVALYYFPTIPSTVKSLNQNCFYPGRGPEARAGADSCAVGVGGCIPVDTAADSDTGCATGDQRVDSTVGTIASCLDRLNDADISPVQPAAN